MEKVRIGKNEVTFIVDEGLEWKAEYHSNPDEGRSVAERLIYNYTNFEDFVTASFENDEFFYKSEKDVFFCCLVDAFAFHCPFVISPDMIWLIICQEFATYINQNAEEMRNKFVEHDAKQTLTVVSETDILSAETDWTDIFNSFELQMRQQTKGDLVQTMTADFSTTSTVERIASQITIMNTVNQYFRFRVRRYVCGIPFITLKGNAEDWKRLMEKTKKLSDYGLGWWTKKLKPILKEFVLAAEGKPNQRFWQNIVCKKHPDEMRGKGCGFRDKPTKIDGWILKFFPFDHEGGIRRSINCNEHMMSELLRVPFVYEKIDNCNRTTVSMELWAGFVGYNKDKETCAIEPKIGWIVCKSHSDDEIKALIDERIDDLELKIKEVPEILKQYKRLKRLSLYFEGRVSIPEWMDKIKIKHLYIYGEMTEDGQEALVKRFPKATLYNATKR